MTDTRFRCPGCYLSFKGWWCDNCDAWPCTCDPDEDTAPKTLAEKIEALADMYDQLAVGTLSAAGGDIVAHERAATLKRVVLDLRKILTEQENPS